MVCRDGSSKRWESIEREKKERERHFERGGRDKLDGGASFFLSVDAFASSLARLNVSRRARTDDAAAAEARDRRRAFDLEAVLRVVRRVASSALGHVVEANTLKEHGTHTQNRRVSRSMALKTFERGGGSEAAYREVTESTRGAGAFVLGAHIRKDELFGSAADDLGRTDLARSAVRSRRSDLGRSARGVRELASSVVVAAGSSSSGRRSRRSSSTGRRRRPVFERRARRGSSSRVVVTRRRRVVVVVVVTSVRSRVVVVRTVVRAVRARSGRRAGLDRARRRVRSPSSCSSSGSRGRRAVSERRARRRRRLATRVDVRRVVVLVRVGRRRRGRLRRSVRAVRRRVRVVGVVGTGRRGRLSSSSSLSVRGTMRRHGRVRRERVTLGELGARPSRRQEVAVVARDAARDLLLVRVRHAEEVGVDRDARRAAVGGARARRELGRDRVGRAAALGLAVDRDNADQALVGVEAVVLVDHDRVDDRRRAIGARARHDAARRAEASRVEVQDRVADRLAVGRELAGRELGQVVLSSQSTNIFTAVAAEPNKTQKVSFLSLSPVFPDAREGLTEGQPQCVST